MSDRFAVALALRPDAAARGQYYFAKRGPRCRDYIGAWSLPTHTVTAEEFAALAVSGSLSPTVLNGLTGECFNDCPKVCIDAVSQHRRNRDESAFGLLLFEGFVASGRVTPSEKYSELACCTIDELMSAVAGEQGTAPRIGTCISALYQTLVPRCLADPSTSYLEVSPALWQLGEGLFSVDDAMLWTSCAADYQLMRAQDSGTDGEFVRRVTLEPFLNNRFETLAPGCSLADLGCGAGQTIAALQRTGVHALGFDFALPPPSHLSPSVFSIDLRDPLEQSLAGGFDVVLLSLVTQWLPDLHAAARTAQTLLKDESSRIIVATVPPEFAKNGRWVVDGTRYSRLITAPVRRTPFLTMVNRCAGPVRYYPHTTPDYLNAFVDAGLACRSAQYLYLDSLLEPPELEVVLSERPDLHRHVAFPAFLIFEFSRA